MLNMLKLIHLSGVLATGIAALLMIPCLGIATGDPGIPSLFIGAIVGGLLMLVSYGFFFFPGMSWVVAVFTWVLVIKSVGVGRQRFVDDVNMHSPRQFAYTAADADIDNRAIRMSTTFGYDVPGKSAATVEDYLTYIGCSDGEKQYLMAQYVTPVIQRENAMVAHLSAAGRTDPFISPCETPNSFGTFPIKTPSEFQTELSQAHDSGHGRYKNRYAYALEDGYDPSQPDAIGQLERRQAILGEQDRAIFFAKHPRP